MPWVRLLELVTLVAFTVQFVRSLWRAVCAFLAFDSRIEACALLLASLLGSWLLADALSGLVHYLGDRVGEPDLPIIGPALIQPFRQHHERPQDIVSHGLVERTGTHALGAFPLCTAAIALSPASAQSQPATIDLVLVFSLVGLAFWIVFTGQTHFWAHSRAQARWIRRSQECGIILSPERHAKHHRGAHESHYCITSGIWDRVFDRLRPPRRSRPQRVPRSI